jgi:hypothetical protein
MTTATTVSPTLREPQLLPCARIHTPHDATSRGAAVGRTSVERKVTVKAA